MRIPALGRSVVALVAVIALLGGDAPRAEARDGEPQTTTLRIRFRNSKLRVRCRGGDCVISIVRQGDLYAVSLTRTRDGVPFTFARTIGQPTTIAIETGLGNDTISLVDVAIPGFLRIGSGPGDDTLELSNTAAGGKTSIDTGRGNDTVHLGSDVHGGKFRLVARDGDDDVTITGGRFEAKAGFDGGPGTDTFVASTNPFMQPPVILGFEQ